MTDIRAPQAVALSAVTAISAGVQAAQAEALAVYNLPSKHVHATQAEVLVAYHEPAQIQASQSVLLAVVLGRVDTPYVRAFTFTLDGHDFYCLRLGDTETLLFDTNSQEWIEWGSDPLPFWRANCGINWIGAQQIAYKYGDTDIIVGDDTWGLLWFLDPTQAWDDYPDINASPLLQQVPFTRICMAQTTVGGRNFEPCYAIFLSGDNLGLTTNDFTPFVQLETSDNQGQTWDNHGVIVAQPDTYDQDYRWTSLGQMQSPGRLFRITDNGILARIDSLEMNDA